MKNYTSIEQSHELIKILPIETADAHYIDKITDFMGNPVDGKGSNLKLGNPEKVNYIVQNFTSYETIPAWSLSALLDVLPYSQLSKDKIGWLKVGWMISTYPDNCRYDSCWHDNPVDACVEMILKLFELNML